LKQQKKKQSDIVFSIKKKAFLRNTGKPFLSESFGCQWNRVGACAPYQHYIKVVGCQGMTDSVHPLVVAQII
jgi:hypothetical protein